MIVNNPAAEFGAAMRDYLDGKGDDALHRASEAARRALAEGTPLVERVEQELIAARRLIEEERRRYQILDQAKTQAARRFEFLAEASNVLVSSFDAPASLIAVARLAVPRFAEWCFVNLLEDDGYVHQLEVAHAYDNELARHLRKYSLFRSKAIVESAGVTAQITPEWCDAIAENEQHAELLRNLCGHSAMVAPLRIRERVLGSITLVAAASAPPYSTSDLALAEDLAKRCALALENSRLYREVIAERDRAERASRGKDEFLAILSHELRNPLMPVIGWTRLLLNHSLIAQDPVLVEGVRSMERNARILGRLVGDCLDLARISEGRIQMERRPVDLNQIMVASIDAVGATAKEKSLTIEYDLAPDALLVLGDAMRLEQVIMNLLVNAVKYTDSGGKVRVSCRQYDLTAEVEVTDTGIGIHPAFLEHIFEPFRRGSGSWLTHQSGLGLGLAIARRIVEMHGGKIWAESKGVDQGSTFRVRLPMAALASNEGARELGHTLEQGDVGHLKILLIEDSEDIVFLLRIELETMGHSVITATDGSTGLALAKSNRPDLIISDIKMPGLNGYELIREIRGIPELRGIPAIALTGFGAKADFDRAMAAGFDACISKPAEPHDISALIKKLTEHQPEGK